MIREGERDGGRVGWGEWTSSRAVIWFRVAHSAPLCRGKVVMAAIYHPLSHYTGEQRGLFRLDDRNANTLGFSAFPPLLFISHRTQDKWRNSGWTNTVFTCQRDVQADGHSPIEEPAGLSCLCEPLTPWNCLSLKPWINQLKGYFLIIYKSRYATQETNIMIQIAIILLSTACPDFKM